MAIRLDKFLSNTGNGTRQEVKSLIKKGLVSVNEQVVKRPEMKIDENNDCIEVNGKKINYVEFEYFMLNKPSGYVSATTDNREKTVLELIKGNVREDLFPVGRLDKDTEGLLIISNDGNMAHNILSPRHHIPKTYYAKVEGKVEKAHIKEFEDGLDIGEEHKTQPAILSILKSDNISEIELTIYEGKYHQVKRMFEAIGMRVLYLKRIKMGDICLDEKLALGEFRKLTEMEVNQLISHDMQDRR